MRRGAAAAALVATGLAVILAVLAGASGHGVAVKPNSGSPHTRFVVSFTAPDASGHVGAVSRRYVVDAAGPRKTGCVSSANAAAPPTAAGARVHVTLDPARFGGAWCIGRFHGQVDEIQGPYCVQGHVCPQFVTSLRSIGKFKFRVRAGRGGHGKRAGRGTHRTDTTPPTFAGLERAVACTPGPQRPGQTTPYTLSWKAATDNVTPSDEIVYDVFYSVASGAENLSKPTWTTRRGATTFRTPGLPSHGSAYFIVRARDRTGNEDHNRVQQRGVDPCL